MHGYNLHSIWKKLIEQNLSKFHFINLNSHAQLVDSIKAPLYFIFTKTLKFELIA